MSPKVRAPLQSIEKHAFDSQDTKLVIMKNIILYIFLAVFFSCNNFEEINTDPARASETLPEYLLSNAQKSAVDVVYHHYYNARQGMALAQYWTGTDKTGESRYLYTDDGLWGNLYARSLADLQQILLYYENNPDSESAHTVAVVEILKAWIFHILTDVYVDIPYSQALNGNEFVQPVFDSGQDVYASLLTSLATQISTLGTESGAIRGDIIGGGDPVQWIKFANALRMRIALRMVDADESSARAVIEEATQNTFIGVEEDFYFPYDESSEVNRFPYNNADRPLVEFAVTTTLLDYLQEVDDPRLEIYARPDETNGDYIGKPYGKEENAPTVIGLSKPGSAAYSASAKGYLIAYAEVAFINAEAAARGMSVGGSAEEWYEKGIRASMKQWGVTDVDSIEEYIQRVPFDGGEWNDVIGTQKWLALYLQGIQGWLERLRMDFNKPGGEPLFIAPLSGSLNPDVDYLPTRLAYPSETRVNNEANSEAAASRIGGDSFATKNWWDTK